MRVLCPAKVNLHLAIGPRREDGYHQLATVFQAVGLWDILEAEPGGALELRCDDPALSCGDDNLVMRAARALQHRFDAGSLGARMVLRKAIPAGGGLGGGSSDAAGALVMLSRLWELDPSTEQLEDLAASLGSDVGFFLYGGTATGTGRGEKITPMPSIGERPIVLGFAPFPIATAEVYRRLAARRSGAPTSLTPPGFSVNLQGLLAKLVRENDFGPARNDLEEVVLDGWPELAEFRRELSEAGAVLALVSGSGSSVFGLFEGEGDAHAAAGELAKRFPRWRTVATRTVASGVRVEP